MAEKSNQNNALKFALKNNKVVQLLEICCVFFVAILILVISKPLIGANPIIRQSIAWVANVAMLLIIWFGLRLRGQNFKHFGLSAKNFNIRSILISFIVFAVAVLGFILGSIIMANIVGIPESADMSTYNYLQGNLPMLLGALFAVFIVSSFGEEIIYRGFLITRISEIGSNSKFWVNIAVLISSIIFGLVHFEWGLMGIGQTGFMGLALGISYLVFRRNLWSLILAHAYMDAILLIQMYFGASF